MSLAVQTITQKAILKKVQKLKIDPALLLQILETSDPWERVKGILPKRPTGLQFQKQIR